MSWDNNDAGPSANWDSGITNAASGWNDKTDGPSPEWDTGTTKATNGWEEDKNTAEKGLANGHGHEGGGRECFNCGQEGHSKAECPNPKVARPFTGTCRLCQAEGHPAAECPTKPPVLCRNCKKEGHVAKDCTGNRVLDLSGIENALPDVAWEKLIAADADKDLDDFRTALKMYCKAVPETTYDQLERAFRTHGFKVHLVAREKTLPNTMTFIDLQGKLDRTFEVGFFFSYNPPRAILAQGWPKSPQENYARLADAGLPMERGIPKCARCSELGHVARECTQEALEIERVQVKCVNCDEVGHRARDCPQPRVDRYACRNCKQSGHQASECTEPRSAEGVECKRCNAIGHFAKDCPTATKLECRNCGEEGHKANECTKAKDPARNLCRNCEAVGHFARDCPQPRDWTKVKCNRCNEMGHTVKRCPVPDPELSDPTLGETIPGVNDGNKAAAPAIEGDWATAPAVKGDWETAPAVKGDWETAPAIKGDWETAPAVEGDWATAPAADNSWEEVDQPVLKGAW